MAQRLALIIGNDDYADPTLAQLSAPQADINALAALLHDPQRGAFDDVQILHNHAQTGVRREIARFFHNRQREDLLLLYFSGHGLLDEEGQLYFATPDTERDLLDATAITAHYINRLMRRCRSRRQILILDCCHSGAFNRSAKGGGLGTEVGIGEAFAGDGTGHIVLAASKATEYAFEGNEVLGDARTSVFTRALIDGIHSGDADLDEDGYITPEELYDYAFRRVREVSPRQTPGKWVYEQTGEMFLARSPRRRLPDDIQARLAALDPLVRFRVVDDLAALLRAGDPALAALARSALEDLALADDSFTVKRAAAIALQEALPPAPPPSPTPAAPQPDAASAPVEAFDAPPTTAGAAAEPPAAPEPDTAPPPSAAIPQSAAASVPAAAIDTHPPTQPPAQPAEPHPLAITWNDYGPLAVIWLLAIAIPLAYTYETGTIEPFFIGVALGAALASGYTFQRLLRWAGKPQSDGGEPVLAGLLGIIPLAGPLAYAALWARQLAPWQDLTRQQRLAVTAYALLILATQAFPVYLLYMFWYWDEWYAFASDHLLLPLAFLTHGTALFLGAAHPTRTTLTP